MPVRWRLTVFNALVMGAILTVLGVSVFVLVRGALLSGVEHTVRDRATGVARTIETGQSLSARDVERLTLEGVFFVVRDRDGRILVGTGPTKDAMAVFPTRAVALRLRHARGSPQPRKPVPLPLPLQSARGSR